MNRISNFIFNLLGGRHIEEKLLRCQSYRPKSIPKFKSQTNLNWSEIVKVLKVIEIFDASRIRDVISQIVKDNQEVFTRDNLFITSFGSEGKSGGKIAYEFRHTNLVASNKIINSWALTGLPEGSTIIFVEDLIGTGSQSTEFILNKLNLIISPSYKPYLMTICATSEGIAKVNNETNFQVINGIELTADKYQHNKSECKILPPKLKQKLIIINKKLKNPNSFDYDRSLLISFYYSPPNNSMPLLWKDGWTYKNEKGEEKKWYALIPRQY